MTDFDKYPQGKGDRSAPGMEIDGVYYSNLELLIAFAKAAIKKNVLTKADIVNEL